MVCQMMANETGRVSQARCSFGVCIVVTSCTCAMPKTCAIDQHIPPVDQDAMCEIVAKDCGVRDPSGNHLRLSQPLPGQA